MTQSHADMAGVAPTSDLPTQGEYDDHLWRAAMRRYIRDAEFHAEVDRAAEVAWSRSRGAPRTTTREAVAVALEAAESHRIADRSALIAARDFIQFHPAVHGDWPLVLGLINKALG